MKVALKYIICFVIGFALFGWGMEVGRTGNFIIAILLVTMGMNFIILPSQIGKE